MTTYYLHHFEADTIPERELIQVHLHGIGHGRRGHEQTHDEIVQVPFREHEPLQETIRRAVFASPHIWKVSLSMNLSDFDGEFYQPVREPDHERERMHMPPVVLSRTRAGSEYVC